MHGIGGILGALLTGALVSTEISGATGSVLLQLQRRHRDAGVEPGDEFWAAETMDMTLGIRVTADDELEGLDISQHGESIE